MWPVDGFDGRAVIVDDGVGAAGLPGEQPGVVQGADHGLDPARPARASSSASSTALPSKCRTVASRVAPYNFAISEATSDCLAALHTALVPVG